MKRKLVFTILLASFILSTAVPALPEVSCKKWIAKVVSIQGSMQMRKTEESGWETVRPDSIFCLGDTIRVMRKSRAVIILSNESVLRLDQETTITFSSAGEQQMLLLNLLDGIIHIFSHTPRSLRVVTPFVNAGVEGTEFSVSVDSDRTLITVFEGMVNAENNEGSLVLSHGQSVIAEPGTAPLLHVMMHPEDAVQWALYYPPILHYRAEDFSERPESDWEAIVRASLESYWKGDLTDAFSRLEGAPEDIRDKRFFNYRAMLMLTVGRLDEARADIERSLVLEPDNTDALALQSIVAVVQNEKETALQIARDTVKADPLSPTARIALSYAQQAGFELNAAKDSVEEAVKLDPGNSLAWARLAELLLSFGNLDEALEAARKAVGLNPYLAHTQTVLGFAYLSQIKTQEAITSFEEATRLDQAAPLPRFGMGLAKIRTGRLKEGRQEIEIAASLDPRNSLIRSYLGKAYYEEKRDTKASDQFAIAKGLDPLDPTPYFYDAIRKQSQNRPVEALHDMQKAIELNDNRAIYRSRQSLDEDLAARSAGLARIYSDLGFQQVALAEGWKSLNTDPGSYSAHRFLADSYSVLPRHEIARVSELLQSQLLQPINITPVQPHLAESGLLVLEGAGPGDLSFNEFNPLFNRDGVSVHLNGVAGENSAFGEELVISAIKGNYSLSSGQYHYRTDGFRENNDLEQDIYNLFLQTRLSYKTSVQAEFRHTDTEKGDLPLRFDPENFLDNIRQTEETNTIRLGFHHAISPGSSLIGSVIYGESDANTFVEDDFTIPPPFGLAGHIDLDWTTDTNQEYLVESQYLLHSERIHITTGIGHYDADFDDEMTYTTTYQPQFPPFFVNSSSSTTTPYTVRHTNLYVYSLVTYPATMIWTLGLSADHLQADNLDLDIDRFNPKVGLTWNPFPDTTVRAAIFRVVNRSLVTNQTIEPTQVAGFNQFFEDDEGGISWRYGIGIDQKLSPAFYGGLEASERDIENTYLCIEGVCDSDWREQLGRVYIYWTPQDWLVFNSNYQYERFDRDPNYPGVEDLVEIKTHRIPLGISFFDPMGITAHLKTTYIDQKGEFGTAGTGVLTKHDRFWVVDASVGYRLPKRWGIVTVEVKNLFDEEINFQDTDPANPKIYPERLILARFTLSI